MKKGFSSVVVALTAVTLIFQGCAGLGSMQKHMEELNFKVEPSPLEVHGDSVKITITGKFPEKYFAVISTETSTGWLVYKDTSVYHKLFSADENDLELSSNDLILDIFEKPIRKATYFTDISLRNYEMIGDKQSNFLLKRLSKVQIDGIDAYPYVSKVVLGATSTKPKNYILEVSNVNDYYDGTENSMPSTQKRTLELSNGTISGGLSSTLKKYNATEIKIEESKNEILKIENAIQLLKVGNQLPEVKLVDKAGATISSNSIMNKKTVLFFWTKEALTHLAAAHKKVLSFKLQHPEYQYIAVNLDEDQKNWVDLLTNYKFDGVQEYRCANFEDVKNKWAITKIHRTLILDGNGKIKDAFTNLFEVKFADKLK